jgi:hypothetical protein
MKYDKLPRIKIGDIYENNANQKYEVVSSRRVDVGNGRKNTKYKVRFVETGYEREVEQVEIKRGKIKDKMEKSVYGVGYMGNVKMVDHKNIYGIWSAMLERCYNKENKSYHAYGEKGVHVCERWHCFENFLNDIKNISGYDEELFNDGKLHLDKDKNQINSDAKVYSLETCEFLSFEENMKYTNHDNQKILCYGLSPSGEIFEIFGLTEFANSNSLQKTHISACIKGKSKSHKGWKFSVVKEELI